MADACRTANTFVHRKNALKKHELREEGDAMAIVLLALLVLILFGAGFAIHLLWIGAVIFAVVWVATFALSRGEGRRSSIRK